MKELFNLIKSINELDSANAKYADSVDNALIKISQQYAANPRDIINLKKQIKQLQDNYSMEQERNRKLKLKNDELNEAAIESSQNETENHDVDLQQHFKVIEPGYQPYPVRVRPNVEVSFDVI